MVDVLCPVVVGRQAELAALERCLSDAAGGQGCCVFLAGEPGIGKSRLAREAAELAERRGAAVVVGRAVPSGASVPYRPLTQALHQAIRALPVRDRAGLRPWLPALGAIVPSVVPQAREADTAGRGEAVVQLLARLVPPAGLVVVLEDLHWSDPDTVGVVEYLADNVGGMSVLLLATVRSEPASDALALARRVRARRGVTCLWLDRLDQSQTALMVAACAPGADAELVARVQREAEGVPLLVEDVLASPGVPRSFADTVRERLTGFPADERLVIDAAAVLGRDFDWELLAGVTGQPASVVSGCLARGVDCLLLSTVATAFRFRHALTREAVLECMLPPRHRALAGAALVALDEARPLGESWRDLAADLAVRSGDRARAGNLLTSSGQESLNRGALATAIGTLRQAADLLGGDDRRADTELVLVEALALAGRVDEAAATGAHLISRLSLDQSNAAARAQVHAKLAHAAVAAARWPMARHHVDAARGLVSPAAPPGLDARLALLDAEIAFAADDTDRARRLAEGAAGAQGAGPEIRCHAMEIVGRSERLRDLPAARAAFESALTTAEAAGLPIWRLRALHELGTIDMFDHAGTGLLSQARTAAEEAGALSTAAVLDLQLSAAFTCRWQLPRADAHAEAALAASERLGLGQVRAKALAMLAGTYSMRAEREPMERYLALCRAAAPDDAMLDGFAWGARGLLALLDGDPAGAVQPYGRGIAVLSKLPQAEPAALRAVWPLLLASLRDRRAAAAAQQARSLGVGAIRMNKGLLGYADAVLAGRAGDRDRADALAATAEAGFVNCEAWGDLARLLAAEAAVADGWGEPSRWLATSATALADLGLHRLADRCHRLLSASRPNPWASAGVTAREADVLRLVAQSLSNKEIAARLHLSPRTVEKHIESLLRKSAARSRTELAVIVAQRAGGG